MARGSARQAKGKGLMGVPENQVKNAVLAYLKMRGIMAWSNNSGAGNIVDQRRGTCRFIRFGLPGSSDIIGILDGGQFLAIECKTKEGRLSDLQQVFLDDIRLRGGIAFVARGIEDVDRELFGK
jgi:hypothetical protein